MIPKFLWKLMVEHRGRCSIHSPERAATMPSKVLLAVKLASPGYAEVRGSGDRAYPGYEDYSEGRRVDTAQEVQYDLKVLVDFRQWVGGHSHPDRKLLVVEGEGDYSPREMLKEVEGRTPRGLQIYQDFARERKRK